MKMKDLTNDNEWLWNKNKFINRKFIMQEMYQNFVDGDTDWDVEKVKSTCFSSLYGINIRSSPLHCCVVFIELGPIYMKTDFSPK